MIIVIGIFAYLISQIFIGLWLSRKISNEIDFVIAGRNLGYTLTTFGIFATWFAADGVLSVTAEVYKNGLPLITDDFFTWVIGIFILGLVFATHLRKMELITFGDLFRNRYGALIEKITALVLIPATLFWAAGQIRAFGVIIAGFSDISIPVAITGAAAAVIIYTTFGGMLADSYTDLIQGLFLIIGLIILTGFMIAHGGLEVLNDVPKEHFQFSVKETPILKSVQAWMIGIFGSIIATELIARILSAKTAKIAKWSTVMGGALFTLFLGVPILMGFVGTHLFSNLANPEQLIVLQAEQYLPAVLFVLFVGALISAILSTVDSTLLAIGSLVAHNIVIPITHIDDKKKKILINRMGVVLFGIIAYVVALKGESVHGIVYAATSVGSAGIVVLYFFSFKGNFGGKWAALAALSLGTLVPMLGDYVFDFIPYPYFTGFVMALTGYLIVGFIEMLIKKSEIAAAQ